MRFEWDPRKAERNLKRRRISFAEASTVFYDPLAKTIADPDHSATENRELTLNTQHWYGTGSGSDLVSRFGRNLKHQVATAPCTVPARIPTRRERKQYEEDES
jgi:hypothetical protein